MYSMWRDFNFKRFFENECIDDVDWLYFYEFNSKIFATFAPRAEKFLFSKNHRDLKMNIFFENLQKPSLNIKEQLSKRKFKIKIFFVFSPPPKWAKQFLT